jgi:prephenate dehydrogenase
VKIAVIGTGLIGTSIALALREHGSTVWLTDSDPAAARLAADLGAGELLPDAPNDPADVAVIAVPPAAVAATERVGSIKLLPVRSKLSDQLGGET